MYLDNLEMDDDHWAKLVEWAYNHPDRVLSPSEVPEADRLKPCIKIARDTLEKFSTMINDRLPGIPGNTVKNLVKVFGSTLSILKTSIPLNFPPPTQGQASFQSLT